MQAGDPMTQAEQIAALHAAMAIVNARQDPHTASLLAAHVAAITVDVVLGDNPAPAPGNRLVRLTQAAR